MIRRVALVSPYDFAQKGGVTEHVQQLARQLRQRNIDVTILAPSSEAHIDDPGLVSLGAVTPVHINGSVAHTTLSPAIVDDVSSLLARTQFDVIHLHEPLAPMLPLSVLNASPVPNIGTFHASGERSVGYAVSRKLLNWLAQRLTIRVAVSPAAARFARQYFAGEYTIIPNGVDTERFNPEVPRFASWDRTVPTILFVGRFEEPRKGFSVLLNAFGIVQHYIPNAQLIVVGRGDPTLFQAQAVADGINNVHFEGSVSSAQLPHYYRSADVFCAPSTGQESFGIILIEAMSSGCPVVASDIEGYAQVVTHRHEGLLVPPSNVEALAASLIHMLSNAQFRTECVAAGPLTAERYAWSDVSDQVLAQYERACTMARPRIAVFSMPSRPWLSPPNAVVSPDGQLMLSMPLITSTPTATVVDDIQGASPMLTEPFEARVRAITQRVVGRVLGRSRITPNMLTLIGLALTLAVTATLAQGYLVAGGFLVLLTSAFDMFDGALARATDRSSSFGAFFDSTIDRYSEAFIFLGLLLHYQRVPNDSFEVSFVYLAIVGSLMVSYTRARAEALGLECKVGLLARPERVILLSLGLIIGWLHVTLAILALFTNITAIQRIYHVWAQTDGKQRSTNVVKPQRRGWFASRDQSPS